MIDIDTSWEWIAMYGPVQYSTVQYSWLQYKLGARTLGARSRGSKNVTYRQQTTDKKVNTEPL